MSTVKQQKGSLMVDAAIGIMIVGVLLIGVLWVYQPTENARQDLEQAHQALKTFLKINGRLPCPDTDLDGLENRNGNNCSSHYGTLPWVMLGLREKAVKVRDSYFLYQVHKRAKTSDNIGDICDPATLFAPVSASYTLPASTDTYQLYDEYGFACTKQSNGGIWSNASTDPRSPGSAHMHLATPPVGTDNAGSAGKLTLERTDGTVLSDVAVYAIVAFGDHSPLWTADGEIEATACDNRPHPAQQENCDLDKTLIIDAPEDKVRFLTPHEAKYILLISGQLR